MKTATRQNSTESTLNPKQLEVIEALVTGASVAEAARRAGVDRSTVYLWMRDGYDFRGQLMLARRHFADAMKARLRELAGDAVKTISDIMSSNEVPAAVRLKAALAVLDSVGSVKELADETAVVEKWSNDTLPFGSF